MSALTFRLRVKPPCRVDASSLAPSLLAGKSRDEISRLSLLGWNESFAVGDLFSITGDDAARIVLDGLDGSFLRVGAGLEAGSITVIGDAGDYAGESMRSGTLVIRGEAGDYLGAGMRGGNITVSGNAGSFAGSGRAGEMKGMSGGVLIIRGHTGDRAGDRMRRGLLLIEGNTGSYCAARMLAGTMVVLGSVGANLGFLMRRGTLMIADPEVKLLPTFNCNGQHELLAIRLLLDSLAEYGPAFRHFAKCGPFMRWLGDLGAEGKGEILVSSA